MKENIQTLWVSPTGSDEERGTIDQPFGDIESALARVRPGQRIVLKEGVYTDTVTIQISGERERPIWIVPAEGATVVIEASSWFLYDVSDLIIEGFSFRNAPGTALSAVGKCERNRFAGLRFVNCGVGEKASSTLFFGGAGGHCNVIEECEFLLDTPPQSNGAPEQTSIAILLTEGDTDGGTPNKSFMIRKNRIENYGHGMLIGSRDTTSGLYGHVVEYNRISACMHGGILVRCGDTTIRGNIIRDSSAPAIAVVSGSSSTVLDNRILDCATGIQIAGNGQTVTNNCLIRCRNAIHVAGRLHDRIVPATAVLVDHNTIVDQGERRNHGTTSEHSGICIDVEASCIAERNLIAGAVKPCELIGDAPPATRTRGLPRLFARDNGMAGCTAEAEGFRPVSVEFVSPSTDNVDNQSGYGASGWVLTPIPPEPDTNAAESMAGLSSRDDDLDTEETEFAEDFDGTNSPLDLQGLFIVDEDDPSIDEDSEAPTT